MLFEEFLTILEVFVEVRQGCEGTIEQVFVTVECHENEND